MTLATEKPDLLFIFTDPRFFIWLFEMEDEIHQVCPIIWWHVWDNYPFPEYNDVLYKSTDIVNCHSYMTYEMIKDRYPDKVGYIPHTLPPDMFRPLSDKERDGFKIQLLGYDKKDHFVGMWVNRNAKRKRPNDVLLSWKLFLDRLEKDHGHRNATLIMHTEPIDPEGPNLFRTAKMLGIEDNIFYSRERIDFNQMNVLYNITDFCLNIAYAEGFGLSTLESMMAGNPIVAVKTGGLARQVVDHRNGNENGVALDVDMKTLVGSQQVPYIYEDYVTPENVSNGIMKLYNMDENQRKELSVSVREYATTQFNYEEMVDSWHESMKKCISEWKEKYERYECITL
jgi:glycosyltransferase involved in cell wall biosynthesis